MDNRYPLVVVAAAVVALIVSGCQSNLPDTAKDNKTIHGVVIEKHANTKRYESWNAPSDPYFVLDLGKSDKKHQITLRPSRGVTTDDISKFKNKRVVVTAKYTDGERFKPSQEKNEAYPTEPEMIITPDGSIKVGPMRSAKRGRGYIVYSIKEQED